MGIYAYEPSLVRAGPHVKIGMTGWRTVGVGGGVEDFQLVIITGLSGAGKTQALRSLEDMGFFCVDNLPPALIPKFAELCQESGGKVRRAALVIDIRGGDFFDSAVEALEELERAGFAYQILYLEASDESLVRRYKETRRRHPLAPQGRVVEGLAEEGRRLGLLRGKAHHIIDTTALAPQDLRRRVVGLFTGGAQAGHMIVNLVSFGFKYGLPLDADLVLDVRFLPNPHYVTHLQPLTGRDAAVREYVFQSPLTHQFLERAWPLLRFLLPQFVNEGKSQLTIGVGCTGGQHRSVALAEHLAELIRGEKLQAVVEHRDVARWREEAGILKGPRGGGAS